MASRFHLDGQLNAAGHVVKDHEGTPTGLALSNGSSADANPIGAPKAWSRRDSASGGVR